MCNPSAGRQAARCRGGAHSHLRPSRGDHAFNTAITRLRLLVSEMPLSLMFFHRKKMSNSYNRAAGVSTGTAKSLAPCPTL